MVKKGKFLGKCWDSAYGHWLRRRQHFHVFLVFYVLPFLFAIVFLVPRDPILIYIATSLFLLGFLGMLFLGGYLSSVFVHWLSGEERSSPHPLPPICFYTKGLLYPGQPTVGRKPGLSTGRKPRFISYSDILKIQLSRKKRKDVQDPRTETGIVISTASGEFLEVPMLFKDTCYGWFERAMSEEELENLLEIIGSE